MCVDLGDPAEQNTTEQDAIKRAWIRSYPRRSLLLTLPTMQRLALQRDDLGLVEAALLGEGGLPLAARLLLSDEDAAPMAGPGLALSVWCGGATHCESGTSLGVPLGLANELGDRLLHRLHHSLASPGGALDHCRGMSGSVAGGRTAGALVGFACASAGILALFEQLHRSPSARSSPGLARLDRLSRGAEEALAAVGAELADAPAIVRAVVLWQLCWSDRATARLGLLEVFEGLEAAGAMHDRVLSALLARAADRCDASLVVLATPPSLSAA